MNEQPPAPAAQCPACGYESLHMIADTMVCNRAVCGYEHLLTRPIRIVKPKAAE